MPRLLAIAALSLVLVGCGFRPPAGPIDASLNSAQTANVQVGVTGVALDHIEVSGFLTSWKSHDKRLVIRLRIDNTGGGKIVKYSRSVKITDAFGNEYPLNTVMLGASLRGRSEAELRPGDSVEDVLVVKRPVDTADYLDLELTQHALKGEGAVFLRIPRSMWEQAN